MGHYIVTFIIIFIIQINWPFYWNHLGQITLVFALLYGNWPLIFKHTCSFSKRSVLFSRLIYRCFITLFSTHIFDYNFDTFCSCKFISCVLKSEYMLLNWIIGQRRSTIYFKVSRYWRNTVCVKNLPYDQVILIHPFSLSIITFYISARFWKHYL